MLELKIKTYDLQSGQTVVCFIDPHTLKRKRKKFSSNALAKAFQKELELRYSNQGAQAFNQTPVNILIKHFLELYPNSRLLERKKYFILFCNEFGHLSVNQLSKDLLYAWFIKMKNQNDLSEKTLNIIKSNLNCFFYYLVEKEILLISPLSKIHFDANAPRRRPRVVLSVDEVKFILEKAQLFSPKILFPFLITAAYTGARRSEVIHLKRSDIDFQLGLITFRKTKNKTDRSVQIPQTLQSLLKTHLETHDSPWAFPDPQGNPIGRQRLHRLLHHFNKIYPCGKLWAPHSLRHSFAYHFLKNGGNMYQLQALLGHKHINMTIDIYGQLQAHDVKTPCPYEV